MTAIDYLTFISQQAARLPFIFRLWLARLLATLLLIIPNRRRNRALDNIKHCLPVLPTQQKNQLLRQHLMHRSLTLLETPVLWHAEPKALFTLITEVQGRDILDAAHEQGRGVILAVPHFGQWELVGLYLSAILPNTAILYKPLSDPHADARLKYYRERTGGQSVPATASGVRYLLGVLRKGGYVGILPDQRPKKGHGLPAGFFGQPAQTMTLLSRLVQRTQCVVVFAGCQRNSDQQHFTLRFASAPPGIDDVNEAQALRALNQGIEHCARWDLPQYQWSYKRFDE